MSTDTQYLTAEKFAELEKELEHLKSKRRAEVAEHLEYAKKLGDLSENAEYHQAREEQAELEDRINRLENLLKEAVIAKASSGNIINVGSTINVEKSGGNRSLFFTIVGSEEADMASGKISNLSPLGAALLGHKAGDVVVVNTPKGKISYKVIDIK